MNFSEITNITIPNGVVNKITTLEGVVLWEKGWVIPDLPTPLANEIYYISTDGNIVEPYKMPTNNTLKSNTYKNGVGKLVFEKDLTSINNYFFNDCTTLQTIVIPQGVSQMYYGTFKDCISLENVIFPNEGFYIIGDECFNGCTKLKTIVLPSTATTIGKNAFKNCTNLKTIVLPDSLKRIDDNAFYGCSSLVYITIPENVNYLGGKIDGNNYSGEGDVFMNCTALKSITIPDSINIIRSENFYNCHSLENVDLGNSVEVIDKNAFYGCSSLTTITIPNTVRLIDDSAFQNCSSLQNIELPSTLTSIGDSAFYNCTNLSEITCNVLTALTIETYTFWNVGTKVPEGTPKILYVPQSATGYETWLSKLKGFELRYITE